MADLKISQMTSKATVVSADSLPILDSANSFSNAKSTVGAIATFTKTQGGDLTGDSFITVTDGTGAMLNSASLSLDDDLANYDNTNSAFITLAEVPALPTNTDLSDYDNTTSSFATTTELSTGLETKENAKTTITDLVSTTITLENANANTDYQYGELTALEITANDTSYLETNIWFTAGTGLNSVTIPATLIPMNDFAPIEGNKCCICIMNDTVLFGTEA